MGEQRDASHLRAAPGLPRVTRAQVRGGSLVLGVTAGTFASSAFNFIATLYRTVPERDLHGANEAGAWLLLLATPVMSILNVVLSSPLIAATNRIDRAAQRQADLVFDLYDGLLPLVTFIALVGAYSFLAVPPMISVMAGKTFGANIFGMPESVLNGAPAYLFGGLTGAAVYTLAVRWMVRASSS
ncbi:hypothetical protein D3273_00960 [Lichenibacterium minor]|uniref:Uncharacterized protein n=1 Tax=Lichenibacterium minor TaxID=2316528 RepID=A0A4Q2UGK8_9HYPH|nr:hypothetical protein [Lichenibacterium minor]RYC33855.1 hypothetical protein D3273_00960 [Lichenibacterium minor]